MRFFFLLSSLLLLQLTVLAQFNDSTFYHAFASATGILNKTNQRSSYVLNTVARFGMSKKQLAMNLASAWIYGEQGSVKSNDDFSSTLDFNFFFREKGRVYIWGLGTFDKSFALKIDHRYQVGSGVGVNVVEHEHVFLNISNGVLYERSELDRVDDVGRFSYDVFRNSLRFRLRITYRDHVTFDQIHFWQPSLSDRNDYVIRSNTTLGLRFHKWLSVTSALVYNKLSLSGRENLLLTFGVTFDRFF